MNCTPTTSDVSIVLDKINIKEFDVSLTESFDQNPNNNGNVNISQQMLIDDNQNRLLLTDISDLELEKVNPDLQIKPLHWTNEYWNEIINKYKWFMHKNNYIGCKICFNIKVFMGKRSLLGTLKLFLMDLSYEELEQKLYFHNTSVQHNKSIIIYKEQLKNGDMKIVPMSAPTPINVTYRKSRDIDHYCPMCRKGYKLKKALAKHIYSCNNERNTTNLHLPCSCDSARVFCIRGYDEHNLKYHSNSLLYTCKFCSSEFKQATVLFGHLLLYHDFYWNPYEEFPGVVRNIVVEMNESSGINKSLTNRPERKKSIATDDNIYIMYGSKDNNINFMNSKEPIPKKINRKRPFNKEKLTEFIPKVPNLFSQKIPPVTDIRIERVLNESNNQEISKLTISQSSIITCEYCGGRYVSMGIFNDHMASYHPSVLRREEEKLENPLKMARESLNKMINSSSLTQINKKVRSTYIRISSHMRKMRALQMKKKFSMAENASKMSEEMRKKLKQKDFKHLFAKRNKVSASILTCPVCRLSFQNLDVRLQHVSINHPELEKFTCKICGLIFTNQTNYRRHLEKSHQNTLPKQTKAIPDKTYSCENCHLVFTNQADLSHHQRLSHPENIEKVDEQKLETVQNSDIDYVEPVIQPVDELDILINTDCNEKPSQCSNCEVILNNPFELLIHSYTHVEHSKENDFFQICPNCSKLFFGKNSKTYLKDHYNFEHLKKSAPQCGFCKLTFSSSYVLEKHQINNDCQIIEIDDPYSSLMAVEKLAFSCSQCGLIIAGENSKSRFDVHMKNCSLELLDNQI